MIAKNSRMLLLSASKLLTIKQHFHDFSSGKTYQNFFVCSTSVACVLFPETEKLKEFASLSPVHQKKLNFQMLLSESI